MLFDDLAEACDRVAATSKRNDKVVILARVLGASTPIEIGAATSFLMGATPFGRIGIGWATLAEVRSSPAPHPALSVDDVAGAFAALDSMSGSGVLESRRVAIASLLNAATEREQRLIRAILHGELRQGALEGVMTSALAAAGSVPVAAVRRAAMMAGGLALVAGAAVFGDQAALDSIGMQPLRPVQPMLASPAGGVAEAMGSGVERQIDWKLDGARVQAHRSGDDVRLFTRNLNDVTERLAGVADLVRSMPGGDLVLDGEAMGILDDGSPRPFQESMRRTTALQAFFFDALYVGEPVHDEPLSVRSELLASVVPPHARLPSIVTADLVEAEAFLERAISAGHEGVMVKDLDQPYEAGRRGQAWRKVKPVYTLDLVVLAVEWGHGRRQGWLSNIHLGARGHDGEFVMVGKTFKGLTDEMLRWQTARFSELSIGEGAVGGRHAVLLQPVQVVEIAVDGVQSSTTYRGGVALRFARVKRYRNDKTASQADTIEDVRALLRRDP